jgi:hypothetical protein
MGATGAHPRSRHHCAGTWSAGKAGPCTRRVASCRETNACVRMHSSHSTGMG